MTTSHDPRKMIVAVVAGSMIGMLGHAYSQTPVRPVTTDPWGITTEDDNIANLTYLSTAGGQAAKIRAMIQADRARVKSRVAVETARPSRRVWIDTADGKVLIDLDVYTSIVIGAAEVEFRESGFATLRAPKTDALVAHVRAYYGGVDLTGKGETK